MAKTTSLSGFPEWLPNERMLELILLDQLRHTFELHGYTSVETRAVEPLTELLRKGETSKEVYVLSRLQDIGNTETNSARQLGLHFDLTVPLARYVVEHAGQLAFPFKRYQIQKVWRGERPQEGRFREFTQADIDVIGQETLPFHYEIELPLVMAEALQALPIGQIQIKANNRKVVQGFCEALGITDIDQALRSLDKLDKIGPEGVTAELMNNGFTDNQISPLLAMAQIQATSSAELNTLVAKLGVHSELLSTGLQELGALIDAAELRCPGVMVADLKIARGLDYYTSSVYETILVDAPGLGSICSGGRYDSLATVGKRTYPGVGLSIGVSRLVSHLLSQGQVQASRSVPTAVLVIVDAEETRQISTGIADSFRARGICTDVSPTAAKYGSQIKYADRRGIPFVYFPESREIKNIITGEQTEADPATWSIPSEYARVQLVNVFS